MYTFIVVYNLKWNWVNFIYIIDVSVFVGICQAVYQIVIFFNTSHNKHGKEALSIYDTNMYLLKNIYNIWEID